MFVSSSPAPRSTVFPSAEELPALVPKPGSLSWRLNGDPRVMAAAGHALMLQVSHPTVGAGVREHSNFKEDPWDRLMRTLDFTNLLVYGGPDAAAMTGRFVRAMHKRIKGVKPNGERYSALEPEAYAWVHATLAQTIVVAHQRFGRRLTQRQVEQFWSEWRNLGRLLGVRYRDLPETWLEFGAYFNTMVHERLEDNETVQDVLYALGKPANPPFPKYVLPVWAAAKLPVTRAISLSTVGLLPPVLRERIGVKWSRAKDLELAAIGAASRSSLPLIPRRYRNVGPMHLQMRKRAIARSYLAEDPSLVDSLPRAA